MNHKALPPGRTNRASLQVLSIILGHKLFDVFGGESGVSGDGLGRQAVAFHTAGYFLLFVVFTLCFAFGNYDFCHLFFAGTARHVSKWEMCNYRRDARFVRPNVKALCFNAFLSGRTDRASLQSLF